MHTERSYGLTRTFSLSLYLHVFPFSHANVAWGTHAPYASFSLEIVHLVATRHPESPPPSWNFLLASVPEYSRSLSNSAPLAICSRGNTTLKTFKMSTSSSTSAQPASSKIFSILGKNLKANTPSELEPYLSELRELDDVEEVHFGGNSLGVEACKAIAEVLGSKKHLKVGPLRIHLSHLWPQCSPILTWTGG